MKNFVVTFGPRGAIITKGIDPKAFANNPNAIVNPSLRHLRGINMKHWTLASVRAGGPAAPVSEPSQVPQAPRSRKLFWVKIVLISLATSSGTIALAHLLRIVK